MAHRGFISFLAMRRELGCACRIGHSVPESSALTIPGKACPLSIRFGVYLLSPQRRYREKACTAGGVALVWHCIKVI